MRLIKSTMPGLSRIASSFEAADLDPAVIWDFDGVIADTEPVHARTYELMLRARGIVPARHFFMQVIGRTENEIWQVLKRDYPVLQPEDVNDLKRERQSLLFSECDGSLVPFSFVHPMLEAFTVMGCEQYIVSNAEKSTIDQLLSDWRLDSYFTPVPAVAGRSKADKISYFTAHYATAIIEDNEGYLRAAAGLGALPIFVRHSLNLASSVPPPTFVIDTCVEQSYFVG